MALIIVRYEFTTSDHLPLLLTRNLVKWLIRQRLFSRQTDWEKDYQNYEEERRAPISHDILSLSFVFENTIVDEESIYWRYMIYLYYVLGYSKTDIAKIVNLSRKQTTRNIFALNDRMKENSNARIF